MRTSGESHWTYRHGGAVKNRSVPEYRAYINAKTRCSNPNVPNYKYYGGRGIEFRFKTFEEFIKSVGLRPSAEHSLDRIDVNGHYEVGNLRWATRSEQQHNRRDYGGRKANVSVQNLPRKEDHGEG